jgi:transposase
MLGRQRAQELQSLAASSIGVSFLADAVRVQTSCLLSQIEFLEAQLTEVNAALAQILERLPRQYLTTIPGVGPAGAAVMVGEIGIIRRFPCVEKLVAYSGMDPATHESGQFQAGSVHMSKRGSPYLRQALWLAAGVARQHDPELKAYFDKRRAEGKPYNVTMGAICHKLLKRIYVDLRDSRPYVLQQLATTT